MSTSKTSTSIEVPQGKRPSLMVAGDRKSSILGKASFSDESKAHLKALLHSPPPCKTRAMTPGGQLFLCVIGSVISVAICVWLALFSDDLKWRRLLFSSGAAVCAIMFALLAYTSKRRIDHPPVPEPLPDLSQRRSTIGGRCSKKSMTAAGLTDHHPTHVLVVNNKE